MGFRPAIVDIMMARPGVLNTPALAPVSQHVHQIAAQPDFPAAIRAIHRAAIALTQSHNALCVLFAGGVAAAAPDGGPSRRLDAEVRSLVETTARAGRRTLLGRIAVEPIGPAPSRAVLIVHRPPTSPAYSPGELATLSAFAMQLQVVFGKLLAL
jgi:hypothetical protein